MQKAPSQKKIKPVTKPFLKGAPVDQSCVKGCALFFLATLGVLVGFLIVGMMMMWDNFVLRVAANAMVLLCAYSIFFYSGANKGTAAVNAGEILYQRREKGYVVDAKEEKASFHPLKGFLIGLVGSLPILLCAVMLALTAQRQMTGYGVLPSWTNGLLNRAEVGDAVAYYQVSTGLQLQDVLRMIIRMSLMPFVNMISAENPDGLLLLERISPLLVLLPAVSYGTGYAQGVRMRSRVHTSIEASKRKSKRKQQRRSGQKQNNRRPRDPERLN